MVIAPLLEAVDEREFTDREKEFEFLYRLVERARNRLGASHAIIARKGLGKTAILERFYNRLFVEQDEVVPFYVSFAEFGSEEEGREQLSLRRFMYIYLHALVSQYVAFHLRDGGIVQDELGLEDLLGLIRRHRGSIPMADLVERYVQHGLEEERFWAWLPSVVQFTRRVLGYNERAPGVLMIDEFQVLTDVWDEDLGKYVDVAQMYQKTAEARWCPMVVTGSAVSLITRTVMGGLLARRFGPYHLGPFEEGATVEYASRLAELNGIGLSEGVAYGIHRLTGGNPHYIWCLLNSSKAMGGLETPEQLYAVYEYEMNDPNGKLRGFWDTHFLSYADRINGSGLSLRVLYHLATMREETINLLGLVDRLGGEPEEVLRVMQQLRQADLVEVFASQLYYRISDPVLAEYIRREYHTALDEMGVYRKEFVAEYRRRLGSLSNAVGRAAELFVVGLMARFDGQEVEGEVFGVDGVCRLPRFEGVENRSGVIVEGERVEFDVVGRGEEEWLVEVKHWGRPVGEEVVERFAERVRRWGNEVEAWLLSFGGFTVGARKRLREMGMRHSDREGFDRLADAVGYVHFPSGRAISASER